jgi:hypothetical protein
VVAIELVAFEPCTTLRVLGLAEIEKSAGACVTVTVTEVLCVAEPSVPMTVNVYIPGAVAKPGATVNVEVPPAFTTVALSVAVSPIGDDATVRLIASLVPVTRAVAMLLVPLEPCTNVRLAGLAEIEKSDGAAVTFTVTDTLWVADPSTPVTVTV